MFLISFKSINFIYFCLCHPNYPWEKMLTKRSQPKKALKKKTVKKRQENNSIVTQTERPVSQFFYNRVQCFDNFTSKLSIQIFNLEIKNFKVLEIRPLDDEKVLQNIDSFKKIETLS